MSFVIVVVTDYCLLHINYCRLSSFTYTLTVVNGVDSSRRCVVTIKSIARNFNVKLLINETYHCAPPSPIHAVTLKK